MRRFSRCARPLLPSQGQVREAGKGRPESLHRSRGLPGASGFTREGFQGQAGRAESCGEIAYAARFSLRCVMSKSSGCVSPVVGQFENERIPLPRRGGVAATSNRYREASLLERTGWSDRRNLVTVRRTDHPVCAEQGGCATYFINRASSPPLRGGECCHA